MFFESNFRLNIQDDKAIQVIEYLVDHYQLEDLKKVVNGLFDHYQLEDLKAAIKKSLKENPKRGRIFPLSQTDVENWMKDTIPPVRQQS